LSTFLAYFRVFFHCLLLRWENCSTGDGKNRGLETLLPGGTGPWSAYIAYLGQQGSSSFLGYTGRKKEIPERLRPGDCWRPFPQWMTIQPVRLLRIFGAADYGKGLKAHQDGTTFRPCIQATGVSNHSPLWGGGGILKRILTSPLRPSLYRFFFQAWAALGCASAARTRDHIQYPLGDQISDRHFFTGLRMLQNHPQIDIHADNGRVHSRAAHKPRRPTHRLQAKQAPWTAAPWRPTV